MILEAIGNRAGMCSGVDLEAVCDPISVEHIMQFGRIGPETVLIAHVDGNGVIRAQISNVLIDKG